MQVQDTAQQGAPSLRTATDGLGWGLIQLSGRVVRQGTSCTDSSGQATVNMTVQEMPEGFGTAAVTCKFVPWTVISYLGTAPEQVAQSLSAVHAHHLLSRCIWRAHGNMGA